MNETKLDAAAARFYSAVFAVLEAARVPGGAGLEEALDELAAATAARGAEIEACQLADAPDAELAAPRWLESV